MCRGKVFADGGMYLAILGYLNQPWHKAKPSQKIFKQDFSQAY